MSFIDIQTGPNNISHRRKAIFGTRHARVPVPTQYDGGSVLKQVGAYEVITQHTSSRVVLYYRSLRKKTFCGQKKTEFLFFDKIEKHGFKVQRVVYCDYLTDDQIEKYGLVKDEIIPVCIKV